MKNIFIIPIVLMFIGCGSKETKVESTTAAPAVESMKVSVTDAQFQNAGIILGTPESKEISDILKLNGKIEVPPQNLVSISIPMGGYLKSTELLPGMMVRKGQVIAILEDQQYIQLQQNYLLAKVKLKTVEAEYFRQKELNASKAASDKVFQQAEAEFKNARINLKALDQNLQIIGINPDRLDESKISKRVSINSPIDGYVAKVNANIGKYLTPSEVLFELVNVSDIHLNLSVYEKDLPKLKIGQKLFAYNNNEPDTKYPCEILLIGHSLTLEKNTEVHCHFKNYDKSLVPGMYMNAEIELKNVNAVTVPEEALVRFGNFEYVFVELKKNHFEMIKVTTGAKENGYVEITNSGKLTNQPVVLKGAYSLLMKLKNTEE